MNIQSEIGALKKVIVHRPLDSLRRLTPQNCHQFLFDDVLWPERAASEHEVFEGVLAEQGAEVYLLHELLAETLAIPEAKAFLINQMMNIRFRHTRVESLLSQYLSHLSPEELVSHILGGMTYRDIGQYSLGLCSTIADPDDFLLPPLPNHLFTRDTSCWIGEGVSINSMTFPARQGETANMAAIYKYHPLFTNADFSIWLDGSDLKEDLPSLEGGDVLVISPECVLVGLGQRTQPQAVEMLAKKLFQHNSFSRIIAIELPKERAYMHLDTLMTMIDYDAFCVAFHCDNIRSWEVKPGSQAEELVFEPIDHLFSRLAKECGVDELRLFYPDGDEFTRAREQWMDASNLLAVKPGMVIGYECNVNTNAILRKAGIEVLAIPGSELGRGRGGSRCMSCPILRENV